MFIAKRSQRLLGFLCERNANLKFITLLTELEDSSCAKNYIHLAALRLVWALLASQPTARASLPSKIPKLAALISREAATDPSSRFACEERSMGYSESQP